MQRLFSTLLLAVLALTSLPTIAESITTQDAWIREAPPVSRVLAGYIIITNSSDKPATLVKVTGGNFSSVELHQTVLEGGVSKMHRQENIVIPAGSSVELKPEGMHMMLFNPVKPVKAGNIVQLELTFKDGNTVPVKFAVKKATGGTDHSHHHMHH